MNQVIVTFKNRRDACSTPPTQLPSEFSASEMEGFLNTLLSQDKAYAFFYNGKEIKSLPDAGAEEVLEIEYLAVTKILAESAKIEEEKKITAISIRRSADLQADSVILCTMAGETREYALGPGLQQLRAFSSFKPIRAVASTEEKVFVLTTTDKVVDLLAAEIVHEEELPIRCITACRSLLAIGLSSDEVVIRDLSVRDQTSTGQSDKDQAVSEKPGEKTVGDKEEIREKKETRIKACGEIGKIVLCTYADDTYLIVGVVSGVIEIHRLPDMKKHKIQLSRPITALGYYDGAIYTGGIGGTITICDFQQIKRECQSDESFISRIDCGTVFFAYTNENRVLIRDKTDFTGTHMLELAEPVADMKVEGKRVFVVEGETLKIFNVFDE